ncbi:hypothetical protein [Methylobacterium haplocladii]|nr:hypothetical protein [Methylobacterium haplocladii]GJD85428.1 hypothetical protein HPGCJGGD_3317 [Methylobacterium haplocladii]
MLIAGPLASVLAERNAALAERDEARRALERDRSTVAVTVNKMRESLRGRAWLLEGGRGPYEWDDDRFREEFSQALDEIAAPLDVLRGIARDWSNCPTDQAEIDLARADRAETEPAALKARIAALEAALDQAEACMSIVQPRSHTAEYLRTLNFIRTALAEGTAHADAS